MDFFTSSILTSNVAANRTANTMPNSPILSQLHYSFTIELTPLNYLAWKMQFVPLLNYHNLIGLIDGTSPASHKEILNPATSQMKPNPTHLIWLKQDQTLLPWLLSSLFESIISLCCEIHLFFYCLKSICTYLWCFLVYSGTPNSYPISRLKQRWMNSVRKTSKAKSLADQLTAIRRPLSMEEFNVYLTLVSKFHGNIAALSTYPAPVSFKILQIKIYG